MTPTSLPHTLDRSLTIRAPRDIVFRYFTDSARWAAWWGAGSTIDATPGGRVYIRHPNGIEAGGDVVEVDPPSRIVFTYGFAGGRPIPLGASRVTVTCDDVAEGTALRLVHEFADAGARDEHVQGWRYQFSVFANIVANEIHANAADLVDIWHQLWAEPDQDRRVAILDRIATSSIRFADRYSAVVGADELLPHIAATQRFMPGLTMRREGVVRHCQGTLLADWIASSADGQERGRGTNVYTLNAHGRIASVTGLWK
jgi:uncharacterized protein YndB with AHSA1/START domain